MTKKDFIIEKAAQLDKSHYRPLVNKDSASFIEHEYTYEVEFRVRIILNKEDMDEEFDVQEFIKQRKTKNKQ